MAVISEGSFSEHVEEESELDN